MNEHFGLGQKESKGRVSIPGPSKRPDVSHRHNVAKRPKVDNWLIISAEKELSCTPIESLVCTQSCPLIRGTLISVSEWGTTSHGTRYSNFVLKDTSGQIVGVIFRSHGSSFEKQFVTGAVMMVANAVVKPIKQNYREKSRSKYELSIPNTLRTVAIEPPLVENYAQPATREVAPDVRTLIRDVVEKTDPHELVNVIGVITEVEKVKSKNNVWQSTITRDFRIIDESETEVAVTIWNVRATRFEVPVGTVIAVYDVAVRLQTELNIKSLTFQKNSRMLLDPPGDDAERLKTWYSEWMFSQGSRSLRKYAERVAASGPGERNCNACVADTPTDQPETIETIGSEIPSATDCITVHLESPPILNSPIVQMEPEAQIRTSAYRVDINDFPDLSSSESDHESKESTISSFEAHDGCPFPAKFVDPAEYNFTKIAEINDGMTSRFVDVLGVIRCKGDPQTMPWSNDVRAKLMVELIDETRQSIWMVVRGSKAKCIEECENSIIAAKKVQVRRRKNRNELICTDKMSTLIVEPKISEAEELRKWFDSQVANVPTEPAKPIVPVALIGDLKDGQIASILGILTRINEVKVIEAKYLYDVARTVNIMDSSEKMIRLALWGELAQDFAIPEGSVVYATNVKIYKTNKTNGALTPISRVSADPHEFEGNIERLQRWYAGYRKVTSSDLDSTTDNSRRLS